MYVYNKYNNTKNYGIQQIFYIFTTTLPTTLSLRWQCVYILYIICLHCRCRILVKVILAVVKQLKQLQIKPRKHSEASTGFNPWPLQYHMLLKICWMTYDNKTSMHVELASVLNVCSFCLFVQCCCLFVCLFVCCDRDSIWDWWQKNSADFMCTSYNILSTQQQQQQQHKVTVPFWWQLTCFWALLVPSPPHHCPLPSLLCSL